MHIAVETKLFKDRCNFYPAHLIMPASQLFLPIASLTQLGPAMSRKSQHGKVDFYSKSNEVRTTLLASRSLPHGHLPTLEVNCWTPSKCPAEILQLSRTACRQQTTPRMCWSPLDIRASLTRALVSFLVLAAEKYIIYWFSQKRICTPYPNIHWP